MVLGQMWTDKHGTWITVGQVFCGQDKGETRTSIRPGKTINNTDFFKLKLVEIFKKKDTNFAIFSSSSVEDRAASEIHPC